MRLVSVAHIDPVDIGVFPERTQENCRRMAEVKVSYQYGTVVPAALCVACNFRGIAPTSSNGQQRNNPCIPSAQWLDWSKIPWPVSG